MKLSRTAKRSLGIVLALVLVAVPTCFTVFPGAADVLTRAQRYGIIGLWLLVAVIAAWSSITRDEKLDRLRDRAISDRYRRRRAAGAQLIRTLCEPGSSPLPSHYEMTVYVPNLNGRVLEPVYPAWKQPKVEDPRIFKTGCGATGKAWEGYDSSASDIRAGSATFVVTGDAVSNDVHELTAQQQTYFAGYRTVAATPILDADDDKIGVLTVISRREDGFFDEGQPGQPALRELADVLGVVFGYVIPTADD